MANISKIPKYVIHPDKLAKNPMEITIFCQFKFRDSEIQENVELKSHWL